MKKSFFQKVNDGYQKLKVSKSSQLNLIWGFFLYTLVGFILLSLPIFHNTDISLLDNLFISTSAVSTTGLVTVGVYDSYNLGGQIIVLILFQFGGIGYMTLTTYYLLFTTKQISNWHNKILGAEFTIPKSIKIRDFIKSVVIFTIVMEILGAIAFFLAFTSLEWNPVRQFGFLYSIVFQHFARLV